MKTKLQYICFPFTWSIVLIFSLFLSYDISHLHADTGETEPSELLIAPAWQCPYEGYAYPLLKWRYKTGGSVSSPPVISGGTVYCGSRDGYLYAIGAGGNLKWRYPVGSPVSGAAVGPDGTIYCGSEKGRMFAISPAGTPVWHNRISEPVRSAPAVAPDGTVCFVTVGGTVYAMTPSGDLRWQYKTDCHFLMTPVAGPDGTLGVGGDGGHLYAFMPGGKLKWHYRVGDYMLSAPAFDTAGNLYAGSGHNALIAVNPEGEQMWKIGKGNHLVTSPVMGPDGTLYAGSDSGHLFAVRPSGTWKWGYPTGGWITARPLADRSSMIYVGSWDGYFYAITHEGKLKWRYKTRDAIEAGTAIGQDGTLYFGSADGYLYALGRPAGQYVVFGKVTDFATGNALENAKITFAPSAGGPPRVATLSPRGSYVIALTPGTYDATAVVTGHQPVTVSGVRLTETDHELNMSLPTIGPLRILSADLPASEPDNAYQAQIPVTGGAYPYAFAVIAGELPRGISLDTRKGLLTGMPESPPGRFIFEVRIRDAAGIVAQRAFGLDVISELKITTLSPLPRGTTGVSYALSLETAGGKAPHLFTPEQADQLPPGLFLTEDGQISGTPLRAGEFEFAVKVKDGKQEARSPFRLEVAERLVLATPYLSDAVLGRPYEMVLKTTGGYGKQKWMVSGLPKGMTFADGVISGAPENAVDTLVTISVSDEDDRVARKAFPFQAAFPLELSADLMPPGEQGTPYEQAIPIRGGVGPFTFQYTGELPKGLSLDTRTGVISGTPEEAIWTNLLITVEDSTAPVPQRIKDKNIGIRITGAPVS